MSRTLVVNGINYTFPETGDENWGDDVTRWADAVTQGMLQKAGGSFTLNSEVDFGPSFGLKTVYYKSRAASPASGGVIRLGNAELISWRNAGNTADLSIRVSSSNWIQFNSIDLVDVSSSQTLTNKTLTAPVISNPVITGTISATDLTITGNTVIGDASSDTLTVNASFTSNLVPSVTNTYNIGSASKFWANTYTNKVTGNGNLDFYSDGTFVGEVNTTAWALSRNVVLFGDNTANANVLLVTGSSFTNGAINLSANPSTTTGAALQMFGDTHASLAGHIRFQTKTSPVVVLDIDGNGKFTIGESGGSQLHTINGSIGLVGGLVTSNWSPATDGLYQLGDSTRAWGGVYTTGIINNSTNSISFQTNFISAGSIDTNQKWTVGATGGSQSHVFNGDLQLTSPSATMSMDSLRSVSLTDNTTGGIVASYASASNAYLIVDYSIVRGANRETGTIHMVSDGSVVQVAQKAVTISDAGVTFSADISAGNIRLKYDTTSTGTGATMKYTVRRWI